MTRIRHLHLFQRGGIYYFRAAVPAALHARLGQREIKLSTRSRDTLHPKTATKYLAMAKSLFIWCEAREYISKVPGKDIEIPFKEQEKPKLPYSPEQLQKLFSSALYSGYADPAKRYKTGSLTAKDEQYWIPLVALYPTNHWLPLPSTPPNLFTSDF